MRNGIVLPDEHYMNNRVVFENQSNTSLWAMFSAEEGHMNSSQIKFQKQFLSGFKQRLYFAKNLPMGLFAGIRLIELDGKRSVAKVPYRWRNKNPFASMYFAVQSMAAELSTAAPAMLAIRGVDYKVVLIITDMNAEFVKKAKTDLVFTCTSYQDNVRAIQALAHNGESASVTAKTIGTDQEGDVVSEFSFTWTFKRVS